MAAAFGYSHLTGGYAGGQAEFARVPYSDVGPIVIPEGIDDDKVLFLSDILPTGWMAAVNCDIEPGDVVAVWGCGPVGLFAIQSALLLGAHRVIAIDHHPRRLALARALGAEVLDFEEVKVREALAEMTGGIGPDACIDAVGMESHGMTPDNMLDHVKVATFLATDRVHALRQVILATRKGGRISIPGVYGGVADKFPIGALMEKGTADQERPDARAEVHARAARADSGRQARHHVPDQPSARSRGCGRGLQELQGKAERIHQGGAEAATSRGTEAMQRIFPRANRSARPSPECARPARGAGFSQSRAVRVPKHPRWCPPGTTSPSPRVCASQAVIHTQLSAETPSRTSVSTSRSSSSATSGVPKNAECRGLRMIESCAAGTSDRTSCAPSRAGSIQRAISDEESLRQATHVVVGIDDRNAV